MMKSGGGGEYNATVGGTGGQGIIVIIYTPAQTAVYGVVVWKIQWVW